MPRRGCRQVACQLLVVLIRPTSERLGYLSKFKIFPDSARLLLILGSQQFGLAIGRRDPPLVGDQFHCQTAPQVAPCIAGRFAKGELSGDRILVPWRTGIVAIDVEGPPNCSPPE